MFFRKSLANKMIIGITGSFGTGKTTVANMFSKYGFKIINVDKLYHGIYNKNDSLKNRIKKEFGTTNRSQLKKIVFNDHVQLKKLNKLTHPIIINEIKKEIIAIIGKSNKKIIINKNKKLVNGKNNIETKNNVKIVLDVPLLIEAKMQNMVDKIVVVKCNEKTQIGRLLKKGRHTKEEIENIIKSQMPIKEKTKYADFVVNNSKAIKETEKLVKAIASLLQKP